MKVYGDLIRAQLETIADPAAALPGRVWWNSTDVQAKLDDGTNVRALLRNDGKCVLGNSGTASQNIRLHRGAAGVLQFVTGDNATAEGSLATTLNQISARLENYTFSGKPSAASAGRLIWATDSASLLVDTGAAWVPVVTSQTSVFLSWVESTNAPASSITNNNLIYIFDPLLGQILYAIVKVPSNYVAGNQIRLRIVFDSPDTSGNALLQTVSTLIITWTDTISSTTNQRTSTNSAVTLSGATENIPQAVACDLTDSSGAINSVSVAAGNLIQIQLKRSTTDTGSSAINVPAFGAE